MRKLLSFFSYSVCLLFVVVSVNAQTRILKKPAEFVYPYEDVDPLEFKSGENGKQWLVFAANEGDVTYTDPTKETEKKQLTFLDQFYVIGEEGPLVEIAKGQARGFELQNAESFGWIHKDRLLLWNECHLSRDNKTKKLLLFGQVSKDKTIVLYQSSDLKGDTTYLHDPTKFSIFYLYKKVGNKMLIGSKERIGVKSDSSSQVIFGWSKEESLLNWNNQIVIEPNWNLKAANERKAKNAPLLIFDSMKASKAYQQGISIDSIGKDKILYQLDDLFERRISSYTWRPLILKDYQNEGIVKVIAPIPVPVVKSTKKMKIKTDKKKKKRKKKDQVEEPETIQRKTIQPIQKVVMGYTTWETDSLENALFSPVILLPINELGDLINRFENLRYQLDESNGFEMRNLLYELWLVTIQKYTNEPTDVIENWPMTKVHEMIYGLPNRGSLIADYHLKDLKEEGIVNEDQISNYTYSINRKVKELKKMYNNAQHISAFDSDGITYYWLSEGLLP